MDAQVKAAICIVCKCSLDMSAPHAIVNHDYAHLDCADAHDARDLGSLDLPERYSNWKDDFADAVGIRRHGEI